MRIYCCKTDLQHYINQGVIFNIMVILNSIFAKSAHPVSSRFIDFS